MSLYLILRPEQNPDQTFRNKWHDDNRPAWISTTVDIGELCEQVMAKGERLFIHRSGVTGGAKRRISCSAKVMNVGKPRQGESAGDIWRLRSDESQAAPEGTPRNELLSRHLTSN
jgi:hypothetical protein